MLRDQKLATGTVENRMTSLHFFFKKVLKRYDPELYDTKLTRVPKKLPVSASIDLRDATPVDLHTDVVKHSGGEVLSLVFCHPLYGGVIIQTAIVSPGGTAGAALPMVPSIAKIRIDFISLPPPGKRKPQVKTTTWVIYFSRHCGEGAENAQMRK